jgi:molecular chaperone GrpE
VTSEHQQEASPEQVPDRAAEVPDADGREPQETAAPAPEAGTGPEQELAAALAAGRSTVTALTEDLQRLQAEYVNYKRRVDRDRDLVKQNATFSVLTGLLPVLDDLDRAREHGELEGGFKAVADSLERIVAAHGLVKFGKPGDPFDPRFHEALMHSHSADVTTTTCQHVISAGYQIGDRVVRPAQVTVVDPEPAGAQQAQATDGATTADEPADSADSTAGAESADK